MRELTKSEVSSVSGGLMGFTIVYSSNGGGSYYDNGVACGPQSMFGNDAVLDVVTLPRIGSALTPAVITGVALTVNRVSNMVNQVYGQAINGKFGLHVDR